MTIGERIKKRREELELTQTNLANIVHSTKQTIYKYENNIITNIPSDKIESIAKALSTTPAYLMGWENEDTLSKINEDLAVLMETAKDLSKEDIQFAIEMIKKISKK